MAMPLPVRSAVVLVDVGSTKKLTVPYIVTHVMPTVQQYRLAPRDGSRAVCDQAQLAEEAVVTTTTATASHMPVYTFRETSVFARTHVCGFAQRQPALQHASWSAAWTARVNAPVEAEHATVGASSGAASSSSRCLFGASPDASLSVVVPLKGPVTRSWNRSVVVSAQEATAEVQLISLRVPSQFLMEGFVTDPFMPAHIQIQAGARHVLHASRRAKPSLCELLGGDLTVLAMVCADHDVASYVSFLEAAAAEAAQFAHTRAAEGTETRCTALLFDATHGLRHKCVL